MVKEGSPGADVVDFVLGPDVMLLQGSSHGDGLKDFRGTKLDHSISHSVSRVCSWSWVETPVWDHGWSARLGGCHLVGESHLLLQRSILPLVELCVAYVTGGIKYTHNNLEWLYTF